MSIAALRGIRCHACQRNVLQSFVTIASIAIAPASQPRRMIPQGQPRANFSISLSRHSKPAAFEKASSSNLSVAENDTPKQQEGTPAASQHVPWYLQDAEAAETSSHTLREQQQLPPLPSNPPPILEGILKHVSVDIGLDNLALVDLRGIDPPPALGINLVMIIATARSVKHLNVSADRLCRWLRKEHKLSPSPDGLIGRNELKIKLRRKARRAKLGKNVGRDLEGRDDGLSTGWICVDVGQVDDGQSSEEAPANTSEFVGFGRSDDKAHLVVQMFTEEMRAEFDLDSLWNRRLDRHKRVRSENDGPPQNNNFPDDVRRPPGITYKGRSDGSLNSTSDRRTGSHFEQRRAFHTTRIVHAAQKTKNTPLTSRRNPQKLGKKKPQVGPSQQVGDDTPSMSSLLRRLSAMPKEEAWYELGQGPHDTGSTFFLRMFDQAAWNAHPTSVALHRYNLVRTAVAISHPNYNKTHLFDAFQNLVASGYGISQFEGFEAVRALLAFPERDKDDVSVVQPLPNEDISRGLKALDHLSLRGIDIFDEDVFFLLLSRASFQGPVRPSEISALDDTGAPSAAPVSPEELERVKQMQNRLIKAMSLVDVRFGPNLNRDVLQILFHHLNFNAFWMLWRKMVLTGEPRSKDDYLLLFKLHAERKHQRDTIKCLWEWIPMMAREVPPVYVDSELATVVKECLLIADPNIVAKAEADKPGVFVDYWLQCSDVLKASKS